MTIALGYVPVTGDVLSSDGLDANVHSVTDGVSLLGDLNGRVLNVNFVAGARIRPEHVRPYETFRFSTDNGRETLDYYQDIFQAPSGDSDAPTIGDPFIPIAGCGTRVHLDYACTVAIYSVACFYTVYRIRERASGSQADVRSAPNIFVKAYIDDVAVGYSIRRTPITYAPANQTAPAASQDPPFENESMLTQHLDLSHLSISGQTATETARCAVGWHTVDLRLFVGGNTGYEKWAPPFKPTQANIDYASKHRFRCGFRSARALGLL